MAQIKFSVVPGRAVTLNVIRPPGLPLGPMTVESPGALKPAPQTSTIGCGGGPGVGGPSGLMPCELRIVPQTLQFSTCSSVRGRCDRETIDSVCGPSVPFVSVTVPPERIVTVPGAKNSLNLR